MHILITSPRPDDLRPSIPSTRSGYSRMDDALGARSAGLKPCEPGETGPSPVARPLSPYLASGKPGRAPEECVTARWPPSLIISQERTALSGHWANRRSLLLL
ncbi:hypothetical protein RRG08_043743 [Elysia crispata]|uniref:Uncharacterized protein n=1 Tax=Elysia crispata TaxID=231223 RepID=A0AAE1DKA5_9GAST|nr:hypothetical protein RRG08_043743 [Elysia crispata]